MRLIPIKILLPIFSLIICNTSNAQNKIKKEFQDNKSSVKLKATEKSKTILGGFFNADIKNPKRYLGIEATAYSNGYGIGLFCLKRKSSKTSRYYALDIAEIKHDKEEKLKPQLYEIQGKGKPLPYIYGKQNSFYRLNVTYGLKRVILPTIVSSGIDISLILNGGLGVGLIKPYYLKLNVADSLNQFVIEDRKYSAVDEDIFLNSKRIYGRSRFGKGLDESKIALGVHFTIATAIDLSSRSVWMKSIFFGGDFSIFSSPISMLVDTPSKLLFANVFMRVCVGKGW